MSKTVALFIPCFVDQLMPQVGLDTVKVLKRAGWKPEFPEEQTCCGQPAFNAGFFSESKPCAERFISVFAPYEYIVCPSGSCTAMVRHEYRELLNGTKVEAQVSSVVSRVYELSEFLVKVAGVTDVGASFPHSVTYHASCHATRLLNIREEPQTLLRNVNGLELREMGHADECCGFGGTFAVKMGVISAAMADNKAEFVEASGAEYVASIDPSCLMHIDGRFRRTGQRAKPIHLASILAAEGR
jgi:L-lactate dehydrogenase complex protein LldE